MTRFWQRRDSDIEARLRTERPEPPPELIERIVARASPPHARRAPRFAFAALLTVAMLAVLASFGGFGYAASSVQQAVSAFKAVISAEETSPPLRNFVIGPTAARDQYGPDCAAIRAKLAAHQRAEKAALKRHQAKELAKAKKQAKKLAKAGKVAASKKKLAQLVKHQNAERSRLAAHQNKEKNRVDAICP